jgi:hypothetical protein
MLTDPEVLGMIEAVGSYTGKKIDPTYFRGHLPIDGIWTTLDVTVANVCAGRVQNRRPYSIYSGNDEQHQEGSMLASNML